MESESSRNFAPLGNGDARMILHAVQQQRLLRSSDLSEERGAHWEDVVRVLDVFDHESCGHAEMKRWRIARVEVQARWSMLLAPRALSRRRVDVAPRLHDRVRSLGQAAEDRVECSAQVARGDHLPHRAFENRDVATRSIGGRQLDAKLLRLLLDGGHRAPPPTRVRPPASAACSRWPILPPAQGTQDSRRVGSSRDFVSIRFSGGPRSRCRRQRNHCRKNDLHCYACSLREWSRGCISPVAPQRRTSTNKPAAPPRPPTEIAMHPRSYSPYMAALALLTCSLLAACFGQAAASARHTDTERSAAVRVRR